MNRSKKNDKKNLKLVRGVQSPLKSDEVQQIFYHIAKGHHIKYATVLAGVERRTFYRWFEDAVNENEVGYATREEQEEFLRELELANALYIDGRIDSLNQMREGSLSPALLKQIQWELNLKDSEIYNNTANTKLEIKRESNPLLEVWQSILNSRDEEDEQDE